MEDMIRDRVHHLYWDYDVNCAGTMLRCLGQLFSVELEDQTLRSAVGLHGAGGYRAQCGLVEGALMFIGIYATERGRSDGEAAALCFQFAKAFEERFGSLRCYDLRPGGFTADDPPHACENLTVKAVLFTCNYIQSLP